MEITFPPNQGGYKENWYYRIIKVQQKWSTTKMLAVANLEMKHIKYQKFAIYNDDQLLLQIGWTWDRARERTKRSNKRLSDKVDSSNTKSVECCKFLLN